MNECNLCRLDAQRKSAKQHGNKLHVTHEDGNVIAILVPGNGQRPFEIGWYNEVPEVCTCEHGKPSKPPEEPEPKFNEKTVKKPLDNIGNKANNEIESSVTEVNKGDFMKKVTKAKVAAKKAKVVAAKHAKVSTAETFRERLLAAGKEKKPIAILDVAKELAKKLPDKSVEQIVREGHCVVCRFRVLGYNLTQKREGNRFLYAATPTKDTKETVTKDEKKKIMAARAKEKEKTAKPKAVAKAGKTVKAEKKAKAKKVAKANGSTKKAVKRVKDNDSDGRPVAVPISEVSEEEESALSA